MDTQKKYKVLVVEDEENIRTLIGELLSERYECVFASDGESAVEKARLEQPAIILLDIILPKMDGVLTCEILRENPKTRHIPILMLTALNESSQRTAAFEAGADDYISKPFGPKELVTRIQSKIRRSEESKSASQSTERSSTAPSKHVCGNLSIDMERHEVLLDNKPVTLSALDLRLLCYFVENVGLVRSRDQIFEAVWGGDVSSQYSRVIEPHIVSLRKKLSGFDHVITTIYGTGYVLRKGSSESTSESSSTGVASGLFIS